MKTPVKRSVFVIGGGAAGFFSAIHHKIFHPADEVTILEKTQQLLSKVKVSGGGRCNVTHACFDISELVKNYPRGSEFLKTCFKQFMTTDTIKWFEQRGVMIKKEDDGRMFPVTNSSQTIIDCFLNEVKKHNIKIITGDGFVKMEKKEDYFILHSQQTTYKCDKIIITTGSSPQVWEAIKSCGHSIVRPVPSLFTFDVKDERIKELPGVSVSLAKVLTSDGKIVTAGPLLITHRGLSGPAILKLSAFGAEKFYDEKYKFSIFINWPGEEKKSIRARLSQLRDELAKKIIHTSSPFEIPVRLWKKLCDAAGVTDLKWASISNKQLDHLSEELCNGKFEVNGKNTFKEEFVTCGGVDLPEVNPETMESRIIPGVYFAGEVLNIDAVTGGFNFQAAWTTGFIAGRSAANFANEH